MVMVAAFDGGQKPRKVETRRDKKVVDAGQTQSQAWSQIEIFRITARQPPRARKFTKKHINKSSIYYILKTYHIAALAGRLWERKVEQKVRAAALTVADSPWQRASRALDPPSSVFICATTAIFFQASVFIPKWSRFLWHTHRGGGRIAHSASWMKKSFWRRAMCLYPPAVPADLFVQLQLFRDIHVILQVWHRPHHHNSDAGDLVALPRWHCRW